MLTNSHFLERLGVYGFGSVEPLILAALVSEDPILLIGKAGTGKTFLLNSISEAMGLEHRHYNASLLSFDDLIGFPYPTPDGTSVTFLPTPATIWEAESVLVDELSRCKPETQNKFFSLIHERKMQGISLNRLRYRWAAMNPASLDTLEDDDLYEGSLPLDQALADRFAIVIEVPDWTDLTEQEQERVIDPLGEGAISEDDGQLLAFVQSVRPIFERMLSKADPERLSYVRLASTMLTEAGYRISPRRARLIARNITALSAVASSLGIDRSFEVRTQLYKLALTWSLPHRAWKGSIPIHIIDSVHAEVVRMVGDSDDENRWVTEFTHLASNPQRVHMLMDSRIDPDTRGIALLQLLEKAPGDSITIFLCSIYPLLEHLNIFSADVMQTVLEHANKYMHVYGDLVLAQDEENHPELSLCLDFIKNSPDITGDREKRALHIFYFMLVNNIKIPNPAKIELDFHLTFQAARSYANKINLN